MAVIKIKPTTPGKRGLLRVKNPNVASKPLLKTEIKGFAKNGSGRNNEGKITVRHKGSGNKKRYRKIDFHRTRNSAGIVMSIEYDPNRTSHVAAVFDKKNGSYYYIIAPKNIKPGDIVKSGMLSSLKVGHSLNLERIPPGYNVHNITVSQGKGGKLCRSAGVSAKIIERTRAYSKMKLNSGKIIEVDPKLCATVGVSSNELNALTTIGKAGRSRWLNVRPTVRGVAMNPIDHPHGGGEGKKSGKGRTPWGKPNKPGPLTKNKKQV